MLVGAIPVVAQLLVRNRLNVCETLGSPLWVVGRSRVACEDPNGTVPAPLFEGIVDVAPFSGIAVPVGTWYVSFV